MVMSGAATRHDLASSELGKLERCRREGGGGSTGGGKGMRKESRGKTRGKRGYEERKWDGRKKRTSDRKKGRRK